jgi:LysM repeat protein
LNYWSIIKPGQKLVILPTSGVLHEVKKGETLDKIVKKYKGDLEETIAYNGLPADASIEMGQKIVIPNGKKAIYYQPRVQYAYQPSQYIGLYGGKSHRFPWGQCTWYIAQKRYIPWGGHAKYWLGNALSYGFQTGTEPVIGAIVATRETWYGHVAYVEAVSGDYITISEMSLGRGKLNTRTLNKNDWRIKGYIY